MSSGFQQKRLNRRCLYRRAKRVLRRELLGRWAGSRSGLESRIRDFLRGRDRGYLLRVVRRQVSVTAVACSLLLGISGHAEVPIELLDVAVGTGGFVINGIDIDDFSGGSVSGAGDVNGDGLDDLIIGASGADPGGVSRVGASYIVFGNASGSVVELTDIVMDGNLGGFVINGIDGYDFSGKSVSGAGDINGDGLDDIIIGAYFADHDGISVAGESYVVFGRASGALIELSEIDLDNNSGSFIIKGIEVGDWSGFSVSGAGDVNGDGLDDVIVGAPLGVVRPR